MPYLFFFNDTATTEIYTLSLHDALPIYAPFLTLAGSEDHTQTALRGARGELQTAGPTAGRFRLSRSEEHTSELQSRQYLVCRLLLEKKKNNKQSLLQLNVSHILSI